MEALKRWVYFAWRCERPNASGSLVHMLERDEPLTGTTLFVVREQVAKDIRGCKDMPGVPGDPPVGDDILITFFHEIEGP